MRYVLADGETVIDYPYTFAMLRAANPDVSFPREPSEETLAAFGVYPVAETVPPSEQFKRPVEVAPVVVEGAWVRAWALEDSPVPQAISPLQARRALRATGLKEAVDAYVATLPEEDQETWEYAVEVRRDNAIIAAGAAALVPPLSSADVDNLFRLGATL